MITATVRVAVRGVCCGICLVFGTPAPMLAQVERAARPGDSTLVRSNIYKRLFEGIRMTDGQRKEAMRLIAVTHAQQLKVASSDLREGWNALVALQVKRDSALRRLVTDEAAKVRFDRRAAAMMPGSSP